MTGSDYELIASTVNRLDLSYADIQHVAWMLADALQSTNPNFDRPWFVDACMKGH